MQVQSKSNLQILHVFSSFMHLMIWEDGAAHLHNAIQYAS